jgi:hypothetical protein
MTSVTMRSSIDSLEEWEELGALTSEDDEVENPATPVKNEPEIPRVEKSTPAFAATAAAADVPAAPVPDALDDTAHVNAWLRLAEESLTYGGGTAARARADLTALVAESKKVGRTRYWFNWDSIAISRHVIPRHVTQDTRALSSPDSSLPSSVLCPLSTFLSRPKRHGSRNIYGRRCLFSPRHSNARHVSQDTRAPTAFR